MRRGRNIAQVTRKVGEERISNKEQGRLEKKEYRTRSKFLPF